MAEVQKEGPGGQHRVWRRCQVSPRRPNKALAKEAEAFQQVPDKGRSLRMQDSGARTREALTLPLQGWLDKQRAQRVLGPTHVCAPASGLLGGSALDLSGTSMPCQPKTDIFYQKNEFIQEQQRIAILDKASMVRHIQVQQNKGGETLL